MGEIVDAHESDVLTPKLCEEDVSVTSQFQAGNAFCEYIAEFFRLVVHVDLAESDNQLVSRYIGGMRQKFQDSLNFFDNVNVSESHQMALHLKKTI